MYEQACKLLAKQSVAMEVQYIVVIVLNLFSTFFKLKVGTACEVRVSG